MKNDRNSESETVEMEPITINALPKQDEIFFMGSRVCDNCGKTKDILGAKTCSKGHFICHSCASGHIHCPLCRHTLR